MKTVHPTSSASNESLRSLSPMSSTSNPCSLDPPSSDEDSDSAIIPVTDEDIIRAIRPVVELVHVHCAAKVFGREPADIIRDVVGGISIREEGLLENTPCSHAGNESMKTFSGLYPLSSISDVHKEDESTVCLHISGMTSGGGYVLSGCNADEICHVLDVLVARKSPSYHAVKLRREFEKVSSSYFLRSSVLWTVRCILYL